MFHTFPSGYLCDMRWNGSATAWEIQTFLLWNLPGKGEAKGRSVADIHTPCFLQVVGKHFESGFPKCPVSVGQVYPSFPWEDGLWWHSQQSMHYSRTLPTYWDIWVLNEVWVKPLIFHWYILAEGSHAVCWLFWTRCLGAWEGSGKGVSPTKGRISVVLIPLLPPVIA